MAQADGVSRRGHAWCFDDPRAFWRVLVLPEAYTGGRSVYRMVEVGQGDEGWIAELGAGFEREWCFWEGDGGGGARRRRLVGGLLESQLEADAGTLTASPLWGMLDS